MAVRDAESGKLGLYLRIFLVAAVVLHLDHIVRSIWPIRLLLFGAIYILDTDGKHGF